MRTMANILGHYSRLEKSLPSGPVVSFTRDETDDPATVLLRSGTRVPIG
jgi:hypothetical protein